MTIREVLLSALATQAALASAALAARDVVVTYIETRDILYQPLEARADPPSCYTVAASTNAYSSCVASANSYLTAHSGCSGGIYTNPASAVVCECSLVSQVYACDRALCPNLDTASLPASLSAVSTIRSAYSVCQSAARPGSSSSSASTSAKVTSSSSTKPSTTSTSTKPTSSTQSNVSKASSTSASSSSSKASSGTTTTSPTPTVVRSGASGAWIGGRGLAVHIAGCAAIALVLAFM